MLIACTVDYFVLCLLVLFAVCEFRLFSDTLWVFRLCVFGLLVCVCFDCFDILVLLVVNVLTFVWVLIVDVLLWRVLSVAFVYLFRFGWL